MAIAVSQSERLTIRRGFYLLVFRWETYLWGGKATPGEICHTRSVVGGLAWTTHQVRAERGYECNEMQSVSLAAQ
eukprot:1044743-Karenia_brevis.AAC.1